MKSLIAALAIVAVPFLAQAGTGGHGGTGGHNTPFVPVPETIVSRAEVTSCPPGQTETTVYNISGDAIGTSCLLTGDITRKGPNAEKAGLNQVVVAGTAICGLRGFAVYEAGTGAFVRCQLLANQTGGRN